MSEVKSEFSFSVTRKIRITTKSDSGVLGRPVYKPCRIFSAHTTSIELDAFYLPRLIETRVMLR